MLKSWLFNKRVTWYEEVMSALTSLCVLGQTGVYLKDYTISASPVGLGRF